MARSRQSKPKPKQLLVEGNSDKRVIEALCKKHFISALFSYAFPSEGGIENLISSLPVKLDEENLETLGIVIDADRDIAARWQAVTNKLRYFGYQDIPKIPPETGWIDIQPEKPKIGVWVMPDNQLPGMLENFVAYLIPAEDKLKLKAENILQEIESEKLNVYSSTSRQKAFIHTWLAWQEKPGMPMGQAIIAKALSNDSPVVNVFITWLNDLFEINQ